jgi:uncharacterized RDD family membrane protein YckC
VSVVTEVEAPSTAGFGRRFGALFYDLVLVIALLAVTTAAFLPLTGGEAVWGGDFPLLHFFHQLTLLAMIVGFYGFSWVRGGQTLGMSAWRIKLTMADGTKISWSVAIKRLAFAWLTLGAGLLWVLFDRQKLAPHDRWTKTRVIVTPKIR